MNRKAFLSLTCVCAVFSNLDAARAGIIYDWVVPPDFGNGVHYSGSITVDPTGISATPIDLTSATIESWQISVFDSANTLLFSLSSSSNFLGVRSAALGRRDFSPKITTTSIFLPVLTTLGHSEFSLQQSSGTDPSISWEENAVIRGSGSGITVFDTSVNFFAESLASVGDDLTIAEAVPEPASLTLSLIAGVFGVWQIRKRRRSRAAAAEYDAPSDQHVT